ncbi:MAG TPA: hypothetical protein QF753_08415 [Victivallales bacterium]|nr:hypothetical protein [Victivallales bacterium]
MSRQYITVQEASKLTGKSEITIRRYTKKFQDDTDRLQKEFQQNGSFYYLIDKGLILQYYNVNDSSSTNQYNSSSRVNNDDDKTSQYSKNVDDDKTDFVNQALQKQQVDLIQQLIQKQNVKTPIFRHSTFYAVFFALLVIIGLSTLFIIYSYKQESEFKKQLSSQEINYTNQMTMQKKYLEKQFDLVENGRDELQKQLNYKEEFYKVTLNEIKNSNRQIISFKDEKIKDLTNQVRVLNSIKMSNKLGSELKESRLDK